MTKNHFHIQGFSFSKANKRIRLNKILHTIPVEEELIPLASAFNERPFVLAFSYDRRNVPNNPLAEVILEASAEPSRRDLLNRILISPDSKQKRRPSISSIGISLDGEKVILGGSNGEIKLCVDGHFEKPSIVRPGIVGYSISSCSFSRSGLIAACSSYDIGHSSNVYIISILNQKIIHAYSADSSGVLACSLSPNGKEIATISANGVIKTWALPLSHKP